MGPRGWPRGRAGWGFAPARRPVPGPFCSLFPPVLTARVLAGVFLFGSRARARGRVRARVRPRVEVDPAEVGVGPRRGSLRTSAGRWGGYGQVMNRLRGVMNSPGAWGRNRLGGRGKKSACISGGACAILSPFLCRGYSSVGRAFEWHSKGQEFDSPYLHHKEGQQKETGLSPGLFCFRRQAQSSDRLSSESRGHFTT